MKATNELHVFKVWKKRQVTYKIWENQKGNLSHNGIACIDTQDVLYICN